MVVFVVSVMVHTPARHPRTHRLPTPHDGFGVRIFERRADENAHPRLVRAGADLVVRGS